MSVTSVLLFGTPLAIGQDPNTPKRPTQTGTIDPDAGRDSNPVVGPGTTGTQNNVFKPGQVKVDDKRGTEVTGASSGNSPQTVFKPGQVKVDDTRGTEVVKAPVVNVPAPTAPTPAVTYYQPVKTTDPDDELVYDDTCGNDVYYTRRQLREKEEAIQRARPNDTPPSSDPYDNY